MANNMINKKWFLYATEFFAGMSVMAVELGASRLLAPYFSSSQIIWTIIIGTIMIAMALGNVIGGRLADKKPNPDRLFFLLLICAVWIALIPFVGKYIIAGISFFLALFITNNFLIWTSFFCCMVIFVFPLLLLGMVTPTLIKHTVKNLENNGKIVGELSALNTVGSILGTFLPTFIIIPTVGTAVTFVIFAVILFVLAAVYFLASRKKLIKTSVSALLIAGLGVASAFHSFSLSDEGIVYEGESMYNYLRVVEDERSISLSTNVLFAVQSLKMKDSEKMTGMYYDYAIAAPYMASVNTKQDPNMLILGLGTGTYAAQCMKFFPGMKIEGVEIDAKIVSIAREYFDLPREIDVTISDGRAYMKNAGKYDVIMIDAYQDITIPFHMSTVEFFKILKEHLKENGTIIMNLCMFTEKEGSINQYLWETLHEVFNFVYRYDIYNSNNSEVFATDNPKMMAEFETNIQTADEKVKSLMYEIADNYKTLPKGKHILTDDRAPVEMLGMGVLDDMVAEEIKYYRDLIKGKSIKEIFDMLKG